MGDQKKTTPIMTPKGALIRGALLIGVDVFLFNQGAISIFVALWILCVSLPRVVFSRRYQGGRRVGFMNVGIFVAAILCVFTLNAVMNRIARERAEELVQAIKAYRNDTGTYPKRLDSLVPVHIDQIPLAKYTLISHQFIYWASEESATLMYMELPPFGRPYFDFKNDLWGYAD